MTYLDELENEKSYRRIRWARNFIRKWCLKRFSYLWRFVHPLDTFLYGKENAIEYRVYAKRVDSYRVRKRILFESSKFFDRPIEHPIFISPYDTVHMAQRVPEAFVEERLNGA